MSNSPASQAAVLPITVPVTSPVEVQLLQLRGTDASVQLATSQANDPFASSAQLLPQQISGPGQMGGGGMRPMRKAPAPPMRVPAPGAAPPRAAPLPALFGEPMGERLPACAWSRLRPRMRVLMQPGLGASHWTSTAHPECVCRASWCRPAVHTVESVARISATVLLHGTTKYLTARRFP